MSDFKQWLGTPDGIFTQGVVYGAALIIGAYVGYKSGDHIYDFGYKRGLRDGASLEKRGFDVNSIDFSNKKRRFFSSTSKSEDIVKEILKTQDKNMYGAKTGSNCTTKDNDDGEDTSTVQDDGGNE